MQTKTLSVEIPSDMFVALNESEQYLSEWLKIAMSIHFYQQQKLTIGKAAQLANLSRFEFENVLGKYNIPISNLSYSDFESDLVKLRAI